MKKHRLCIAAALFCAFAAGCQKAPDAVEGNGIRHAQGELERQVQDIAEGETPGPGQGADGVPGQTADGVQKGTADGAGAQSASRYEGVIGTGGSKISINAEIPGLPDDLYIITLQPDEGLDRENLLTFLDSGGGNIEDTSEELLRELEENDRENSTIDENGERFLYSRFGDHSASRLGDGTKSASFTCHTGAYYVDHALKEKCLGIFNGDYQETPIPADQMGDGSFSADQAVELLRDKIRAAGAEEFCVRKVYFCEGSDYSFYRLEFVPSCDGIAVDIGANSYALGQVWPNGYADVSVEGVAEVTLTDFCGRPAEKEPVAAITFEQAVSILEQYLDQGMIESDGSITYHRVALHYYPVPDPAPAMDEIEYKSELVLIPMWHIWMPLDEYVDGGYGPKAGPSHICVNAVTGELIQTD